MALPLVVLFLMGLVPLFVLVLALFLTMAPPTFFNQRLGQALVLHLPTSHRPLSRRSQGRLSGRLGLGDPT